MISYAEAKVKIWEVFEQVITYTPQKSKHLRKRSKELRSRPEFFWRSFCLDRVRLARVIQGIKDEQATTFLFTRKFLFNTHISSSQPEQWARSCVLRLPWPPDDGRCRLLSASKTSYTLVALAISYSGLSLIEQAPESMQFRAGFGQIMGWPDESDRETSLWVYVLHSSLWIQTYP